MRGFRPEWARKLGERKARECGFDSFPIDPFAIAADEDIFVEEHKAAQPGVSGGIIFDGPNVGIFYSTAIRSPGFHRFTIGHELGHYFLPGHPEELQKVGPLHASKAGFSAGDRPIEIEADHFSSGLLLPGKLVRNTLDDAPIGLSGIEMLAELSECSLTASAIRSAECSPYPMAVVVSQGDRICYGFLSEGFKQLGPRAYPRKGDLLPASATRQFNAAPENVISGARASGGTTVSDWFEGSSYTVLDEEVIGLGSYGFTLTVFSSEELPEDPYETEDEETDLIESYQPKFARGR